MLIWQQLAEIDFDTYFLKVQFREFKPGSRKLILIIL
jgi:hypothetical protein